MNDYQVTDPQLRAELDRLRARVAELEHADAERKRAEQALGDNENDLKAVFNAGTDAMALLDTTGVVLAINEAGAERFGQSVSEMVGRSLQEFLSPEATQKREHVLTALLGTREPVCLEDEQEGVIYEARALPVLDEKQQVRRIALHARDVTQQRQAEAALRQSEARWRTMTQNSPDYIITLDREGTIRFANHDVPDFRRDEAIGKKVYEFVAESDRPRIKAFLDQVIENRRPDQSEMTYYGVDGVVETFELHAVPLEEADEEVVALVSCRNITNRKQAERALVESEERLTGIVASITDHMSIMDRDHSILWANDKARTLFGDDLVGKKCYAIYHQRRSPCEACIVSKVFQDGQVHEHETVVTAPDGSETILWCTASPVGLDSDGKPARVIEISRDITEQRRAAEALQKAHDELEQRVEQRTAELAEANQDLHREIAERRRAEEALKESEERYRSFVQNFPGIAFRGRLNSVPVFLHGALEEITGYTEQDFLAGKPRWDQVVHPEDLPGLWETTGKALRTVPDYSAHREYRIVRKDDEVRWVEEYIENRCDASGRPAFVEGAVYDITERKRAEEALHASEENYRTIFNAANDAIFVHDPESGEILDVNQRFCEMFGYTVEEARELSVEDVSSGQPPYTQEEALRYIHVAARGEPQTFEWLARGREGQPFWVEVNVKRVTLGGQLRVLAVARDISERKEAEDELRQSERRYRGVVEDQTELICRYLADGTLTFVNEACCRYFGRPREELIGLRFLPLVREEYRDFVARQIASISPEHPIASHEQPVVLPDGKTVWQHWTNRGIYDEEGHLVEYQAVGRDITQLKQAEEATRVFTRSMAQSRDGILITDAGAQITFANPMAEELLGVPAAELVDRPCQEVLVLDRRTEETIAAALRRQHSWSGLVEVLQRDRDPLPIELTRMLIPGAHGRSVATVDLFTDGRRARRLESLQHVTEIVAGTEDGSDKAIRRVMTHLPELVGFDHWVVFTLNSAGNQMEILAFSENSRKLAEARPVLPVANALAGQAIRGGEILRFPDVQNDHRLLNDPELRSLAQAVVGSDIRSIFVLPIRSGHATIGLLGLADRRVRGLTPEELNLLRTLASQLGLLLGRERPGLPPLHARGPRRPETITVVAESAVMKQVLRTAKQIAATELPVILLGPTGSGKGHLSRYIHAVGPRADGPYLTVNCACLDGDLILSELFGHERGAFTGAVSQQKGCFELANGGTLLLDEVVELPLSAQAKLLHLIETQQFRRLGGQETITTDVRIICTTNADIHEYVRTGRMRQDLYYRLNAAEITVPPLRDRPEDIEPLAQAWLRTQALAGGGTVPRLTDGALNRLRDHHWPGNVRELQNALSQATAQDNQVVSAQDLRFSPAISEIDEVRQDAGPRGERDAILDALRKHRWNRTLTARELGIHRNTLRDRMRKYGIVE